MKVRAQFRQVAKLHKLIPLSVLLHQYWCKIKMWSHIRIYKATINALIAQWGCVRLIIILQELSLIKIQILVSTAAKHLLRTSSRRKTSAMVAECVSRFLKETPINSRRPLLLWLNLIHKLLRRRWNSRLFLTLPLTSISTIKMKLKTLTSQNLQ